MATFHQLHFHRLKVTHVPATCKGCSAAVSRANLNPGCTALTTSERPGQPSVGSHHGSPAPLPLFLWLLHASALHCGAVSVTSRAQGRPCEGVGRQCPAEGSNLSEKQASPVGPSGSQNSKALAGSLCSLGFAILAAS